MDDLQKTQYIIDNNHFMILATADESGKPWVSPVGFISNKNNFYWISNKDALHSKNIASRPEVAISIFGKLPEGPFDGVYLDSIASVVVDESELQELTDLFAATPQPPKFKPQSTADVSGDAVWRIYKAVPLTVSKRAETVVNGQTVTIRQEIEL